MKQLYMVSSLKEGGLSMCVFRWETHNNLVRAYLDGR